MHKPSKAKNSRASQGLEEDWFLLGLTSEFLGDFHSEGKAPLASVLGLCLYYTLLLFHTH